MFCRTLFVLLSFLCWVLCCLSLDFTDSDYPFDIFNFSCFPGICHKNVLYSSFNGILIYMTTFRFSAMKMKYIILTSEIFNSVKKNE